MSLPAPGGPRPPLRVIGVGLVAAAVGLTAVGVVTAGSGSSETAASAPSAAAPTTRTSAAATTSPTTSPSASPAVPSTTLPPAPVATLPPAATRTATPTGTSPTLPATALPAQPAPYAAPTNAAVPPQPPAPPRQVTPTRVPVRVFNNSTITGLGEKAAREIRAAGWQVVEVGNFQGLFPTTTVYYQPGEQEAAQSLASSIGATAAPRIVEIASYAPGLILVVTSDFAG